MGRFHPERVLALPVAKDSIENKALVSQDCERSAHRAAFILACNKAKTFFDQCQSSRLVYPILPVARLFGKQRLFDILPHAHAAACV